jgi:hypothetical protein
MPGPMPYHLEKGPWIMVLESFLNGTLYPTGATGQSSLQQAARPSLQERQEHKLRLLDELTAVGWEAFLAPAVLDRDRQYPTFDERQRHIEQHWFGATDGARQPPFRAWLEAELGREVTSPDVELPGDDDAILALLAEPGVLEGIQRSDWPQTGFWQQYYGNVEAIMMETIRRALVVSLGLDGERQPTRDLPIEIFWKCPQRWFETWVTWRIREDASDVGQVTVIIATPGAGTPVLERYGAGRLARTDPDLDVVERIQVPSPAPIEQLAPGEGVKLRGMWAVTHEHNLLLPALRPTRPRPTGDWIFPDFGPSYAGVGPVIIVSPSIIDGGVHRDYSINWGSLGSGEADDTRSAS